MIFRQVRAPTAHEVEDHCARGKYLAKVRGHSCDGLLVDVHDKARHVVEEGIRRLILTAEELGSKPAWG